MRNRTERAKAQEAEIVNQARVEAERIKTEARQQATQEREQLLRNAKDQVAELVTLATRRVLQAELAQGGHDRLIEESISQLGNQNRN
ncbi:MAG: hypothetical protein HC876_11160 [Chloroflexaceae bacterium]|nr:hypothetical protein [Chloroflexaceae bacterium]